MRLNEKQNFFLWFIIWSNKALSDACEMVIVVVNV